MPTAAGVLGVLYLVWRSARQRPAPAASRREPPAIELDSTPDEPVQFGCKNSWLAVRAATTESVAEVAGINDLEPANWRTGMAAAYNNAVFLSPPVNGWVLIVGYPLPELDPERLDAWTRVLHPLAGAFPIVCYFGTHRVVGYNAWAKFVDGVQQRAFSYLGERSEVLVNEGPPTADEVALGHRFSAFPVGPVESDNEDELPATPDEEDVLNMAAAWSVSTRDLPDIGPNPSSGWVSRTWPVA